MKFLDIKGEWMKAIHLSGINKILVCLALWMPLAGLTGCSGEEDTPQTLNDPQSCTVPASTTILPSGGVLTSEYADSPKGQGISYAVDRNNNTKFVTEHSSFYIHWEGAEAVAVNYYSLTSAADAPEKDPKSWSLKGSNDNSNWTLLDEQSDQSFTARKEKKEFEFVNDEPYKYIRLEIEANNGGSSTQIAELNIKLFKVEDIEDLMKYAGGYSNDASTPMGKHYANKHVTTEADRQWLAKASNEPLALQAGDNFILAEFPVRLYPTNGIPSPADANQHGIGDCCAIAVFASFAYIYPDFIRSIITDNGDGTFTVAMFDPQGAPIKVSVTSKFVASISDGKIQAVTGKNDVACWSTVLEKAMMKWNYKYQENPGIGGIGTELVAPLFTGNGNSFAFSQRKLDNDQLARAVRVSLKQGKIVVGGFDKPDLPVDGEKTVTAHAWTLMHSSDASALFAMRNPWGSYGSKDGVLNIPNNDVIPPSIDLRIVEPGIAAKTGGGVYQPYTPPVGLRGSGMRLSPELMRFYGLTDVDQ